MSCATCVDGLCRRRGVPLTPRLRHLCATDHRYAELFDKRFGIVDDSVIADASKSSLPVISSASRQAQQRKIVSSIGTRLMEIFNRDAGGEAIECDECKKEIIRLNSSTPEEVERDRAEIIDGILRRSQNLAPKFYQRLALKTDALLGTGKARAYFNKCLDEAIKTGVTPDQKTVHIQPTGECTGCKTITQVKHTTVITTDRTASGSSRTRTPNFVPADGTRVAAAITPKLACPVPAYDSYGPRHLLYHVYPVSGNGMWQWNVEQLLQRIEQFDGVRSVAIVTKGSQSHSSQRGAVQRAPVALDSVAEVQRAFSKHKIDHWVTSPNAPTRRETVTRTALMKTLPVNGVTFYAHAKGVTHGLSSESVRNWADVMYQTSLDSPQLVANQLQRFYITGPFKAHLVLGRAKWHYSGSFYWFRNDAQLLNIPCPATWFGVEEWPGIAVDWNAAGCLFGEGFGANRGELYHIETYGRISPLIKEWRAQHV